MYYSYAINLAEPRFATMTPTWKRKRVGQREREGGEGRKRGNTAYSLYVYAFDASAAFNFYNN